MRANTMTKDQDEPSMEDILSSIRQIISEDDSGAQAPANSDTPRKELQSDREIIDLIHQLKEDGTVEKIKPFSETPDAEDTVMAQDITPEEDDEISADDLITKAMDETSLEEGETQDEDISDDDVIDLDGEDDEAEDIEEIQEVKTQKPSKSPPTDKITAEVSKAVEENLMSESALSEAASALDSLSRLTATPQSQTQSGPLGDKSVEGLVKDVLRPLLKEWLDENLPSFVRAIVTEQVEKIVRENNKKVS